MSYNPPKIISLFNHKGGVSKTTTTFNLGWMLAELKHKVLLVDTDPQCNLTGLILGADNYEKYCQENPTKNIYEGLRPAFESQPKKLQPIDCISVKGRSGLFLLPGHVNLSEYEVQLGIAQELSGSLPTLKNLPGAFYYLIIETAKQYDADYILIDMNPGLGSINQNLLMISNFFIVPTSPDYFSVMAIESLTKILPRWVEWAKKINDTELFNEAVYQFPPFDLEFLGYIIQKFRRRGGKPAKGFDTFFTQIQEKVSQKLIPSIEKRGVKIANKQDTCLAPIPDFNTMMPKSQLYRCPVFALKESQLKQTGIVLEQSKKTRAEFRKLFKKMTQDILKIVEK